MKLVVSGGGTGGHVYPALTVIKALLELKPVGTALPTLSPADILWIGSRGGIEDKLVKRAGLDFIGLKTGGLRGVGLLAKLRNTVQMAGSLGQAQGILARFRPDVILTTGGYASVPVTVAGWIRGVPILIYLPDIVPGLAIRLLSRIATRVAVTSEESRHHLRSEKVVVTGYPVRREVFAVSRSQARAALGLAPAVTTLLVFGGSQGARSINQALVAGLRDLLPVCQIVHITGRLDIDWVTGVAKGLPQDLQARYHPHAYLHEMAEALVASDLAVARAGAATLGEFPAAGLPAVLVPYPYSGQHQQPNADYMAQNGAAQVLTDAELGEKLVPKILELMGDEDELAAMRESSRAMSRPDAAEAIGEQLWLLARERIVRAQGTGS